MLMIASTVVLAINEPNKPAPLRISTWYWLNSINKERWEKDFQSAAQTGFTDLVLCWGLDGAGSLNQKDNTFLALDLCKKYNLKAYLFMWHPIHNSLPRQAEFQQVDNKGNLLFTFNLFNRQWRETQWREYLQSVAQMYKDHPAFSGYVLDDTFGVGPIGNFGGDTQNMGSFVSYSAYDFGRFREFLQAKYSLPSLNQAWETKFGDWAQIEPPREITATNEVAWRDWTNARREWLREWANDTVKFIREIDSNSEHEVYIEDTLYALGVISFDSKSSVRPITLNDVFGLDFGYVVQPFDAVCGYTYFSWDSPDALENAKLLTEKALKITREKIGPDKKIIYTFWTADINIDKPLPVNYPDSNQIIAIAQVALDLGIRHIDYYGFRIGDWRVRADEWPLMRPNKDIDYTIMRPFIGRFLWDRPEVLKQLKEKHQELKARYIMSKEH